MYDKVLLRIPPFLAFRLLFLTLPITFILYHESPFCIFHLLLHCPFAILCLIVSQSFTAYLTISVDIRDICHIFRAISLYLFHDISKQTISGLTYQVQSQILSICFLLPVSLIHLAILCLDHNLMIFTYFVLIDEPRVFWF